MRGVNRGKEREMDDMEGARQEGENWRKWIRPEDKGGSVVQNSDGDARKDWCFHVEL